MKKYDFIVSLCIMSFLSGQIIAGIGDVPKTKPDPYSIWDMLFIVGFIWFIYLIGLRSGYRMKD